MIEVAADYLLGFVKSQDESAERDILVMRIEAVKPAYHQQFA